MRLTKIQKVLRKKGIDFRYSESYGTGDIDFNYAGSHYSVSEYTGNHGDTVAGILTNFSWNGADMKHHDFTSQSTVCEVLERIIKEDVK